MKVLVLGGCGIQGRTAIYHLSCNPRVEQITCADIHPELILSFDLLDKQKIQPIKLDADGSNSLASIMASEFDIVLDFLPPQYVRSVTETAINVGVNLVNTNYAKDILDLDDAARKKGISIIPECGLDPGIDLVLYNYGLRHFDTIYKLNSYCGGIPAKSACDNPLNYKISWNIEAVLRSQMRDATLIADSQLIHISAEKQHDNAFIHQIEFPGIGKLEAIPNGNAAYYADLLKLGSTLQESGRYTLRWPGWSALWHPLKKLGFLSEAPIKGLPENISALEFTAKLLAPELQYKENEKDLCVMVNKIEGERNGHHEIMTNSLLIERDFTTGLMGMSMGVAYPACIAAEMIVNDKISKLGILSPATDIPPDLFIAELRTKGIKIKDTFERVA